jgi:hypothetical protein
MLTTTCSVITRWQIIVVIIRKVVFRFSAGAQATVNPVNVSLTGIVGLEDPFTFE